MATTKDINSLTTLESLQSHLGVASSSNDLLLTSLINQISARIETITGRRFNARDYRLWLNTHHRHDLVLPEFPIIYINRVATGAQNVLELKYNGSDIRASANVFRNDEGQTGGIRLVQTDSSGAVTKTVSTAAANLTTSAMATTIAALSDWTATALVNVPTLDLHPSSGQSALANTVFFTAPDSDESDYRVNHENGIIELTTSGNLPTGLQFGNTRSGFQSALVECRLGFETIPVDIELIANQLISQAFSLRSKDTNVISENIGTYSYTLAARVNVDADTNSRLMLYKDIRMGGVQ